MIIENIDSSKLEKVTKQIEIIVQSNQIGYVKREFEIKNKKYTYHGPENNETATLIQILSQMQSKSDQQKESFLSKQYQLYLDKEKEWNLQKSLFNKNFSVGLNEIIKTIVYWSAFFSVLGESVNIKNDPLLERDQTRQSIAQFMPLYAFLYTFFSQIFQQIHDKIIWLILFICLIIIPTLVMVGHHFDLFSGSFHFSGDYVGLALCITSISVFINSFLNKIFFYLIKKVSNELVATLFNCSLCILISYFILFKIIAFVLLLKTKNFVYIINSIADLIAPSLFIQLFFLSIFLIKRLFLIRPNDIIRELNYINNQQYPEERLKKQYINYLTNNKIANFFKKTKFDSIGQLFISAAYASLQIYFYIHLIIDLKASVIDFGNVISYSFLLFASPIYIVIGIYLQTRKISEYRIYLFIPLFLGATLSLITLELWNIFSDSIYLGGISRLIGISPLLITLVWLTLRFFRIIRLMQKMLTFTIVCYFFIFPIGILLTLAQILQDSSLEIVAFVLFLIGLIPLVILILYYFIVGLIYIIKLPQQAPKQNFEAYKYLNLKAYARWLNSIFFVISFYALSYFAINEPETATGTKKGTVIGLLVIHIILFIQTNIALGYKAQDQNNNLASITQNQDQKQKDQDYYLLACQGGIVLPFIILLPLALILDGTHVINETTFTALVACSIGVPLTFAYFYAQIKMRRESFQYQNFLHPFFVFLIWIFLIGPIGVIIPILADIFQNESSEFALFAQLAVAYTIIAIILAVTFNAVFYSILLNKEYLEMKKKEVLKIIMQKLVGDGIYSPEDVLALIFLRYLQEANPNKLKEDLVKNGDPVNIWVDKEHKQKYYGFEYEIILVSKSDFESRLKLVMIEEHKKQLYRARRRQLRELKAKQEAEGKKEEAAQAEQLKIQENKLQEQNEKDKLSESCMGLITNCLYQFFFCKYGYLELEEYGKHLIQEQEEKKKQDQIKEKNKQINEKKTRQQERRQTLNNILERNEKVDFKESLKSNFPDRAERFWLGVHKEFQNKFSTLLEIFELERDDELMQKVYKSFQKVDKDFTISVEDFALFLHYHFTENNHQSYHAVLYDTAITYYDMIIANHQEVLTTCIIRNSNTAFHHFDRSQYPLEEDKKLFKLDLNELDMLFQQLGLENYSKPNWIQIKLWEFCQKAHQIIWILPIKYTQQIMGFISSSFFPKLQIPEIKIDPKNEGWEKVAEDLSDTLVKECDKFEEKMQYQDIILKFSITNILAIIFKLYDIYSLATLAFKPQVGWSGEDQVFDPVQSVDYSIIWNEYNFFFSLALLLSVIYIVFGIKASQQIKTNTFGYDEKGDIAGWRHFNFWLSKTISFISGQFIFVMKTFIDSIICDYTSYPYTLVRQPVIECMSDVHFIYVVFAFLGCGIYYPLTTYLQPTFQYMDNSLDLKYQSSFVVILSQGKLLILGLSSVFSNLEAKAYLYQMLFSSIIIIILIIFQFKMFPCYVRWFNFIDLGLLSVLFYFYFGAFLVMASGNPQVGIYFLLSFAIITIIVIAVILFKKYRLASQNSNTQQVYPGDQKQSETSVLKLSKPDT